ncbi:MAG: hypothetical protein LBS50_00915 [Prevotellaceae bacterium]|jgi:hypothetical protein|nr:hypothetical protein [Prevotellaceae bacterium]
MNKWTELSIEYANQGSYLDDLFAVYPTSQNKKYFENINLKDNEIYRK